MSKVRSLVQSSNKAKQNEELDEYARGFFFAAHGINLDSVVSPYEYVMGFYRQDEKDKKPLERKARNCTKGISCGNSCISPVKTCKKEGKSGVSEKKPSARKKVKAIGTDNIRNPDTKNINFNVDKSNFKDLIGLGEEFAKGFKTSRAKLDELIEQKKQLLDEINARGKKGATQRQLNLAIKLGRESSVELMRIDSEDNARMKELRNAVIEQNGVSQKEANAWSKSKSYGGDKLFIENDEKAKKVIQERLAEVYQLTGGKGGESVKRIHADSDRAFATAGMMDVGNTFTKDAIFHEYGHHVEYENSKIYESASNWMKSRSSSSTAESLAELTGISSYGDEEKALPDKFVSPYVGKIYSNATEVVSMGLEHFENPGRMRYLRDTDPEHFHLILGILLSK